MADTITLNIDDREIQGRAGMTVLHVARAADIYIPTLCYHPILEPYGGCRMCIVEIEKMRGLPPSCTTPAANGMVVKTNTHQLQELRRSVLELVLSEHPHPCLTCWRRQRCRPGMVCLRNAAVTERCVVCPKNYRCELQTVSDYVNMTKKELKLAYSYRGLPLETMDPFLSRDYNLCILCGRCVRVCQDVRVNGCLAFTYRGSQALVGTAFGRPHTESGCEFCGACVDICPVGTHMEKDTLWTGFPEKVVTTTCPYCGTGCQLKLEVKGQKILRVRPDPDAWNQGQACVKGRFGIREFVHHPERLSTPLIKQDRHGPPTVKQERLTTPLIKRASRLEPASWDEALDLVARKLSSYRPHEVAVFCAGKCTNEDNYVMQKFARAVLKTNNIDHCARLCHAPSIPGLVNTFGSGAMTNPINDLANSELIFVIGANTTYAHPVIGMKVKQASRKGKKLVVANPREIELVRYADVWLRLNPGSDVALLMGMARAIVEAGLEDRDFIAQRCENFEAFRESLDRFDPAFVEKTTGIPWETVAQAARLYAQTRPAAILYAMGITQSTHGTDNVMAIANLAMLTGNVGRPGAGVCPLRGHNNVQGSCDMGGLPEYFPGYQRVDNPDMRKKFEEAWGTDLPPTPGLTLSEIVHAAYTRQLKALYLMGENIVLSEPCVTMCQGAMEELEFLVVQDLFLSDTARLAQVVLPACSFAEKDGTYTNTERRVQRVRKAVDPLGDSRPDWWIVCEIARRMGGRGFDYQHPSQIMAETARLVPQYGGVSYERLEAGGLQWPCPTPDHPGTPILHTHTFTRGKGRFLPLEYRPPAELPDKAYPLILTTERSIYQFHTGTLSRRVKGLNELHGEEWVEMSPRDAQALGIATGDVVRVSSRRGEVEALALVTEASPPGTVAMTFHFLESPTNVLTNPEVDPVAKIPEYKFCAVRVEKVDGKRPVQPKGVEAVNR